MVVGSAVYILQWMPEAHDFMERFKDDLRDKPVWAFSVGMNGVPKHSEQDGNRVGPLLTHVNCRELRTFPAVTSLSFCRCVSVRSRVWLALWRATSATGTRSRRGPTASWLR